MLKLSLSKHDLTFSKDMLWFILSSHRAGTHMTPLAEDGGLVLETHPAVTSLRPKFRQTRRKHGPSSYRRLSSPRAFSSRLDDVGTEVSIPQHRWQAHATIDDATLCIPPNLSAVTPSQTDRGNRVTLNLGGLVATYIRV
jgi:hypothetical protein